ncbi:MAG: hypothetical protein PHR28_00845 [candidate division Zixibacteria bacterium]|nr:hypothetical protein [candidate division Zixibacteria bacterium]
MIVHQGRRWPTLIASIARILILGGLSLIAVIIISCGPPKFVTVTPPPSQPTEESQPCIPRNLTLDSTASRYALIAWDPGCPQERIMRGFNIYVLTSPLAARYPDTILPSSIQSFNKDIYPGDTLGNPQRETYVLENIPNAVRQYVHVRVVYIDGSLSRPSNEIEVICYQQGRVELAASFSGSRDGFIFRKDAYCRTDDLDNDIYFYSKNGDDFLCSPSRLGQVSRDSKLYPSGEGQPPAALGWPSGQLTDRVQVRPDQNLVIETADGDIVGIRVRKIDTSGSARELIFEYLLRPGAVSSK